jgi:cyclin B
VLQATPFVQEMYAYYRQEERCARPGFLENSQVTQTMRSNVIDWIIHVHCKFRLIPETLYLAVNIFDRYLERNVVSTSNELKLLGAAALLISSKYEEVYYLDLYRLVAECGGVCTRNEVRVLQVLLV